MIKAKVVHGGEKLVRCASCGSWVALRRAFLFEGRAFCGSCVWSLQSNNNGDMGGVEVVSLAVSDDQLSSAKVG